MWLSEKFCFKGLYASAVDLRDQAQTGIFDVLPETRQPLRRQRAATHISPQGGRAASVFDKIEASLALQFVLDVAIPTFPARLWQAAWGDGAEN